MKKNLPSVLNVGLPSILTIFLILALVTFATLSLVTSRSENQRAQQSAQRSKSYGDASVEAERILAEIDQILCDSYHRLAVPDEESYLQHARPALDAVSEELSAEYTEEGLLVPYHVPISDTQQLQVELLAQFPSEKGDSFFRILKWATSSADPWNADETLPVYGNDE